eukprot:8084274-Pyramimonas_sp.AAC.1
MHLHYAPIDSEALELRGHRHQLPMGVLHLCSAAYKSARSVCLSGIIAGPLWATRGIIAGRSMATTLIRAHARDAFDAVPRSVNFHRIDRESSELSSFDAYIYDASISAIGPRSHVRFTIANMASLLLAGIRQMLGGRVALDKVALVCSCDSQGQQLEADLGPSGVLDACAVNLGCDDTAD